jgi:nitroreductase
MDQIPPEATRKLILAGQRAPTGGNVNTRRFIVIDDPQKLKLVQKLSPGYAALSP